MTTKIELHPVCKQLKDLRLASGLSLAAASALSNVSSIVLGSYERGDRRPPLDKLEQIFNTYGYTRAAVPTHFKAVQLPGDMADTLRTIADQLERTAKGKSAAEAPQPSLLPGL
jgi:transcriptional regulator with XRE-family HTH domain